MMIYSSDVASSEVFEYSAGEYTTTVYLGTPLQQIEGVVLDTGSYMPWFKVEQWCTKETCPGVEPSYNSTESSTFSYLPGRTAGDRYGTGALLGAFAWDEFCFNQEGDSCFSQQQLSFVGAR